RRLIAPFAARSPFPSAGTGTRPLKILRWIVLPPLVILAMAIAVANRSSVTFSLDPFDTEAPALGFDVPLFLIILASVLLGILIGGMGAWAQARRKRLAREPKPHLAADEPAEHLPAIQG